MSEHQNGCSTYTARRLPVIVAHAEHYLVITDAIAAERRIKGWTRAKKDAYMRGDFPLLCELAKRPCEGAGLMVVCVVRDAPAALLTMREGGSASRLLWRATNPLMVRSRAAASRTTPDRAAPAPCSAEDDG